MTPEREELIRRTWSSANRGLAWEYLRKNGHVNLPVRRPIRLTLPILTAPYEDISLTYSYRKRYNETDLLCLHEVTCEGVIVYSHIESCERVYSVIGSSALSNSARLSR